MVILQGFTSPYLIVFNRNPLEGGVFTFSILLIIFPPDPLVVLMYTELKTNFPGLSL